jgi:hypothetical protein
LIPSWKHKKLLVGHKSTFEDWLYIHLFYLLNEFDQSERPRIESEKLAFLAVRGNLSKMKKLRLMIVQERHLARLHRQEVAAINAEEFPGLTASFKVTALQYVRGAMALAGGDLDDARQFCLSLLSELTLEKIILQCDSTDTVWGCSQKTKKIASK